MSDNWQKIMGPVPTDETAQPINSDGRPPISTEQLHAQVRRWARLVYPDAASVGCEWVWMRQQVIKRGTVIREENCDPFVERLIGYDARGQEIPNPFGPGIRLDMETVGPKVRAAAQGELQARIAEIVINQAQGTGERYAYGAQRDLEKMLAETEDDYGACRAARALQNGLRPRTPFIGRVQLQPAGD